VDVSNTAVCPLPYCRQTGFDVNVFVAFTHILEGKPTRSKMIPRPCTAERWIFVPVDVNLRMAVVVPNHRIPHNHPMPVMMKASYDAKASYRESIAAAGVLGATVKKVDNGKVYKYYVRWINTQ
jgi:hypothetical protein